VSDPGPRIVRRLISLRESDRFRVLAAAVLVAWLAGSVARFGWFTGVLAERSKPDFVTENDLAMAKVRRVLDGYPKVGYLTPEQTGSKFESATLWGFSNDEGRIAFFLTQYALAPTIVLNERVERILVTPSIERAPLLSGYEAVLGSVSGPEVLRKTKKR
jgi:hypothetical protein